MTSDEFEKVFDRNHKTPILRHPELGVVLATLHEWAGTEEITYEMEYEDWDGEIKKTMVTENVPADFYYIGLWTPISWKCEGAPDGWIDYLELPEDIEKEMLDCPDFLCVNLEDLKFTGKYAK